MTRVLAAALGVLSMASFSRAQTDELYMVDAYSNDLFVCKDQEIVRSWELRDGNQPLAVFGGTVRTWGHKDGNVGAEYDLNGTWSGTEYQRGEPRGQAIDGTTDGNYNYVASWTQKSVWQFDRHYANGREILSGVSPTGISYDLVNETLWVANDDTGSLQEYDLGGNLVSEWSHSLDWVGGVAYEPSTDTLWFSEYDGNELHQYDKEGNHLQTIEIPGTDSGYHWGLEFSLGDCEKASWRNYGEGHPGTNGIPQITSSGDPALGTKIAISVDNSLGARTLAAIFVGFRQIQVPGSWGGDLLVDPTFILVISIPDSGISGDVNIPDDPGLCGIQLNIQALAADGGASNGLSSTPGLELNIGS